MCIRDSFNALGRAAESIVDLLAVTFTAILFSIQFRKALRKPEAR